MPCPFLGVGCPGVGYLAVGYPGGRVSGEGRYPGGKVSRGGRHAAYWNVFFLIECGLQDVRGKIFNCFTIVKSWSSAELLISDAAVSMPMSMSGCHISLIRVRRQSAPK